MIVDKTGRQIVPGQILDLPVLALTGAMVPARVLETVEPSHLIAPNSAQSPPFVGIEIKLQLFVRQVAPNVYMCDNAYVVLEAQKADEQNTNERTNERTEDNLRKLGLVKPH